MNKEKAQEEFTKAIDTLWEEVATWVRLKHGSSPSFMAAYDSCFRLCTADEFKFGYDYLVALLETTAPTMKKDDFLEAATTLHRATTYMHRYEIPVKKLRTVYQVAEDASKNCLDQKEIE